MDNAFLEDIYNGLVDEPRRISSRYLYDERGSQLFQEIMQQPEYYLTRAEWNIFETHAMHIVQQVIDKEKAGLQILELGAGDGRKTELVLDALEAEKFNCVYEPVDIDPSVLHQLKERIKNKYKYVRVQPRPGFNNDALHSISADRTSLVMFLGSNIGNYRKAEERDLIKRIGGAMKKGDYLLMGADKAKDPDLIAAAYNDQAGKTAEFSLNLIHRINEALKHGLDPSVFRFYSFYHPVDREVNAFLINEKEQKVIFPHKNETIELPPWSVIQTEVSRKYTLSDLKNLGKLAELDLIGKWQDGNQYFYELLYRKGE